MSRWQPADWPGSPNAPSRADRAGGAYRTYLPDPLTARALLLDDDVARAALTVEDAVRGLGTMPGSRGLEGLARFLLRSEAIASSRIEGLQVSPQQVGLAELAGEEELSAAGVKRTARRVAANIAALRQATHELAQADELSVSGIEQLQTVLLVDEPSLHGLREVQNWIGGSNDHPLGAEFVPPVPDAVAPLMNDLVNYANRGDHAPLVQAGLVHAQFETIHPFKDGNGRVGRALVHTVLVRRGLTRQAVLPVSPVLLTRSEEYVAGLTAYRYDGDPGSTAASGGVSAWLRMFLQAVLVAVDQAQAFAASLDELRNGWQTALATARREQSVRANLRSDSATARILDTLQEHPVLTSTSVMRLFEVSRPTAGAALADLTAAGVLSTRRLDGRTTAYLAMDVFELITFAERRLASTRWDTVTTPPNRATPYGPG